MESVQIRERISNVWMLTVNNSLTLIAEKKAPSRILFRAMYPSQYNGHILLHGVDEVHSSGDLHFALLCVIQAVRSSCMMANQIVNGHDFLPCRGRIFAMYTIEYIYIYTYRTVQ